MAFQDSDSTVEEMVTTTAEQIIITRDRSVSEPQLAIQVIFSDGGHSVTKTVPRDYIEDNWPGGMPPRSLKQHLLNIIAAAE